MKNLSPHQRVPPVFLSPRAEHGVTVLHGACPCWIHAVVLSPVTTAFWNDLKNFVIGQILLWLFCMCSCSKWARCDWLRRPVVADTRQMLCVSSPRVTHDCQPDWLHNWEVEACASRDTRTVLSFSWEYKMEKRLLRYCNYCFWWKWIVVSEAFIMAANLPWDSWAHPDLQLCYPCAFGPNSCVLFSLVCIVGFILTSTRLCFHAKGVSLVLEPLEYLLLRHTSHSCFTGSFPRLLIYVYYFNVGNSKKPKKFHLNVLTAIL